MNSEKIGMLLKPIEELEAYGPSDSGRPSIKDIVRRLKLINIDYVAALLRLTPNEMRKKAQLDSMEFSDLTYALNGMGFRAGELVDENGNPLTTIDFALQSSPSTSKNQTAEPPEFLPPDPFS